jgi:hypothetical protein
METFDLDGRIEKILNDDVDARKIMELCEEYAARKQEELIDFLYDRMKADPFFDYRLKVFFQDYWDEYRGKPRGL